MSYECKECGAVDSPPRNCTHCGGRSTMVEIGNYSQTIEIEQLRLRVRIAEAIVDKLPPGREPGS